MDSVYENKDSCYETESPFMHKYIPNSSMDIDTESELRNQSRLLSRCPESRYDPTLVTDYSNCDSYNKGLPCNCDDCKQKKKNVLKNCKSKGLEPEYTRIQKPCDVYFGLNNHRTPFEYSGENPQSINKIQSNNYIGENTRNLIKDAYKMQSN